MKKIFKYVLVFAVAITGITSVSSCSKDDDDEKAEVVELRAKLNGKWTLVKYDNGDNTWGEYAVIAGNTMEWNNRLQGENSKYDLIFDSDSSFTAKCVYSSLDRYEGNDWSFTITKCTSDSLITLDSYGHTRSFARVYSE